MPKTTAHVMALVALVLLPAGCSTDGSLGAIGTATAFSGVKEGPGAIGTTTPAADENELALVAPTVSDDGGQGIRFTPIIGAPMEAVVPLAQGLRSEAAGQRLAIEGFQDDTSEHTLKGYLSAETFDGKTQIFYVWDVFDADGRRLHRISGLEEVDATADTAWKAVTPRAMEHIAERTVTDYLAWRATRQG